MEYLKAKNDFENLELVAKEAYVLWIHIENLQVDKIKVNEITVEGQIEDEQHHNEISVIVQVHSFHKNQYKNDDVVQATNKEEVVKKDWVSHFPRANT